MSKTLDLEGRLREALSAVSELPVGTVQFCAGRPPRRTVVTSRRALAIGFAVVAVVTASVVTIDDEPARRREPPVLDSRSVRLIADASESSMSSGTGHMEVDQSSGPGAGMSWSVDLSFSGNDISETITSNTPPPPQQPNIPDFRSTYGMALIHGVLYRQIVGQWYAEAAKLAPDVLASPTPTTFLTVIEPSIRLVSLGTDKKTGWIHLQARNPAAAASALNHQVLGLGYGDITSLNLWIDSHNIVQQMAWTTSYSSTCPGTPTSAKVIVVCPPPSTDSIEITFSHLGTLQMIRPPQGALPGSGPFDEPNS